MSGQIKLCQRWKENKADPAFFVMRESFQGEGKSCVVRMNS